MKILLPCDTPCSKKLSESDLRTRCQWQSVDC